MSKNAPSTPALRDDKQVTLSVDPTANALSVQQLLGQVQLIQQVMGATMRDGEHFGKIPGCGDKPTLLKPGAEKLCLTFRLAPAYAVEEKQLERGHREYRVLCTLSSILTGAFVGQGVGVCTSMEGKYRYRQGQGEPTDRPVPRAYWDLRQEDPAKAQEIIGGKGFSTKKVEGKGWMICKGGEKTEHDNPADHYNTVLKMAKKRALVDAVLTATAASDIFTQDLEDISANIAANVPAPVAPAAGAAESQPAVVAAPAKPSRRTPARDIAEVSVEEIQPAANLDWRNTRVHFGKNRGLLLSELTANQVHWYETEWMPKKENGGIIGGDDLALIEALKANRDEREGRKHPSRHAADDDRGAGEFTSDEAEAEAVEMF